MGSFSEGYKAVGADVAAGYRAVESMKSCVVRTTTSGVLSGLDNFDGLFCPDPPGMEEPVLVSDTDGVGTKLYLAFLMDQHDITGIDCVAIRVNDVVCGGTQSLSFLDYLAIGKNCPEKTEKIVADTAESCVQSGCTLVGGEVVKIPGFYLEDGYNLAGLYVGMVDHSKIIDDSQVQPDDVILGFSFPSVHSNGFSPARKVFRLDSGNVGCRTDELGKTLGGGLLTPTGVYVKSVLNLMR